MRRVAIVLAVLVAVLTVLISLRLWTQARALSAPSGGSGEVEGVTVDLSSRVGARIVEVRVKEGQAVKKGDLLLRLDCADPQAALAEAEARLAVAHAQAEASQRGRTAAGASQDAALAQAEALEAQRDAAVRQAKRLAAVQADVAASSLDQTEASASGLTRQTAAARAQAAASAAQARAADASLRAAEAQVKAGEAQVARARLLADECEIRAPRDAEVAKLPHEAGELVTPSSTLVRLVDLSEVTATFYLPNAEVGAVRPGGKAWVEADAYPGERFEGTVKTVALEAEFTPRNIQTRTDRDRLVYPIEIAVTNRDGKLRDGMPVQVTLERSGK
jgi:HlyD family secretion protein